MNIERREIEYVTTISGSGLGLPMVIWGSIGLFPPVWGFLAIPVLTSLNLQRETIDTACLVVLGALIAAAIYLTVLSVKYYRINYGRVRIEKREKRKNNLKYSLYVTPAVIAFTAGLWVDTNISLPISVSIFCFAIFCFVLWAAKGRGVSNNQLWLGIVLFAVSFFPLLGFRGQGEVYGFTLIDYTTAMSGIYGLIIVIDGLFDHSTLVRKLKPVPKEEADYEFV